MKHETHTPGPWHIGKRTFAPYVYGPKGEEVAGPSGFTSGHEETQANARLIAAAPDMLAASVNALALLAQIHAICIDGKPPALSVIRELARDASGPMRSAIARATGAEGEGAK